MLESIQTSHIVRNAKHMVYVGDEEDVEDVGCCDVEDVGCCDVEDVGCCDVEDVGCCDVEDVGMI